MQGLFDKLIECCADSSAVKSSHWKAHTAGFSADGQSETGEIDGFGRITKPSHFRAPAHAVLRTALFGSKLRKANHWPLFKTIADQQHRLIDLDMSRHIFTFDYLADQTNNFQDAETVCIIGDGQANFVSPASCIPSIRKIVSINLPEVLISDLEILRRWREFNDQSIGVATDKSSFQKLFKDRTTNVILVPAQFANVVMRSGIKLFVNIASFQEMTNELVSGYFESTKSNAAFLYCCNREEKKLYGGEVLRFADYPWGDCQIILDELCPWHQRFYSLRPPFFFHYDGPIRHRFVKF